MAKQNTAGKIAGSPTGTETINSGSSELAAKYAHIPGWGVDADPENEPTYPMKNYTGDDHKRSNYERPVQQPEEVELLRSIERPTISAVYGDTLPPSGLSGQVRRMAFTASENRLRHWLPLILADRIDVVEGILDDLAHGHIPNIGKELGWKAEWKHNRTQFIGKMALMTAIWGGVGYLIYRKLTESDRPISSKATRRR